MKKLRQQLKEAEMSRKELAAEAAAERRNREEVLASKQKAEADLAAARQAHAAELAAEKSHYESLLSRARAAQVQCFPIRPHEAFHVIYASNTAPPVLHCQNQMAA